MQIKAKPSFSFWALLASYILILYSAFFFYPRWEKGNTEGTFGWDVSGYYMYLPATFIYKDLKQLAFRDTAFMPYHFTPDFQQATQHSESGNFVLKYSSGQALVMLPGFVAGHLWAKLSDHYKADGFSLPYQIAVSAWMLLVALVGLYWLRKVLLYYFRDSTVAILLLIYCLGTNYLNYVSIDQLQTHNSLFTLYCLLLLHCIRFYERPTKMRAAWMGALCGLATLIRPTEVISVLLPLLWGIPFSLKGITERLAFWKTRLSYLVLAIACFVPIVFVQLLYWKSMSGHWVVYSYGEQGFSFLNPHFYNYTLGYECGWLRYCPMMLLAVVGFIPLWTDKRSFFTISFFALLAYYIVSSWDIWDYGGTAGRAMVQYYPALAFPFCALIEWANKKSARKFLFYPFVLLGIYLNIWWLYNAHKGKILVSRATKQYYLAKVGCWTTDEDDLKLLDTKHVFRGTPQNAVVLARHTYEKDTAINRDHYVPGRGLRLDESYNTSPALSVVPSQKGRWLRGVASFMSDEKEWEIWKMPQLALTTYLKGTENGNFMFRISRQLDRGIQRRIWVDARPQQDWDSAALRVLNPYTNIPLYVDSLEILTFYK